MEINSFVTFSDYERAIFRVVHVIGKECILKLEFSFTQPMRELFVRARDDQCEPIDLVSLATLSAQLGTFTSLRLKELS